MSKFLNDISMDDVMNFINTGAIENAPEEVVQYLKIIESLHGMHLRIHLYGTEEQIIKTIRLQHDLSLFAAKRMYNEMLEFYYADTKLAKDVWRNIIFKKMMDIGNLAMVTSNNVGDLEKASKIFERAFKIKDLDVPELPKIPEETLKKPYKVYTMNAEFLGMESINRLEVAKQIDELDLSINEKELLKQDAAISPIKLFDNEQEDSRQPE